MSDLWLTLLPLLLTDVANPVLFALLVFLAGGSRGVTLSVAALAGHTAAYFVSGILIALAYDQLTDWLANPGPLSYGLGGLLGALLLIAAWLSRGGSASPTAADPAAADPAPGSIGAAFVTGAVINFIGVPFALPYFAAIDQILKTDVDATTAVLLLAGYNLAYLTPFLVVPLLTLVMGQRAQALLARINATIERLAGALLPLILGLIGVVLLLDAVYFFVTGTGLI